MSQQRTGEYVARVHSEDDGSLWAEVLDLPGCFASGDSLDQLKEALEEAISLYVADEPAAGQSQLARQHLRVDEIRLRVPS